jgi:uncharacterized protein YcbK (DUF882 family)
MRPEDWVEIRHFTPEEFKQPLLMGWEFVRWLDALRERAGVPMVITSSYRSPERNEAVGGATDSAHCDIPCNAVDLGERPRPDDRNWNLTRWQIVATAMAMGCQRIGSYQDGSLHLDMTHDRRPAPRMWRVVGAIPT